MDLNSSQKLFLHGVLFHYLASQDTGSAVRSSVEEIMSLLEEDLTSPPHSSARPEPPDDDDDDDEFDIDDDNDAYEEEEPDEPHEQLDTEDFLELTELSVTDDRGRKCNFIFVEDGDTGSLMFESLRKEDGSTTVEGPVRWVRRFGKSFLVMTEDGVEFSFDVSKFPKDWTKLLRVGEKTGP